jgi:methionyl-tRNA synthetase
MSKSKGNVIYADDLVSIYGVDAVRYFVLHEMPYSGDGIITWELVTERNNSDLANTLGNLVKRTISMTNQYFGGKVVASGASEDVDDDLKRVVCGVRDKVAAKMDEYKIADALDELWTLFRRANKYIDETAPWLLVKDESKKERLAQVLFNLLESINIGANLLKPFMPATADKIFEELGTKELGYNQLDKFRATGEFVVTSQPSTLFQRIKHEDIKGKIAEIEAKQRAEAAPVVEEEKVAEITIDDFAKVQMKVGKVIACEAVKKSKLLHETVQVGNKTLSILSGIAKYYTPEEMVGKKVVVVTNLPPREMKGILSEGMIVCAEAPDGTLSLVTPEKDVPDGSTLA